MVLARSRQLIDRLASGGAHELPVSHADLDTAVAPTVRPWDGQRPLRIEWIVPPVAEGSGGHVTMLRLVQRAEERRLECRLRFHDALGAQPLTHARRVLRDYFPAVRADLEAFDGHAPDADILVATSWPTAWAVASAKSDALRAYLIQDYEPWFYAAGSHAAMAARTYELGLLGVAIGEPLAALVRDLHGMDCLSFNFGVDTARFFRRDDRRDGVLFYGRPETPRRGFELGAAALRHFAQARPTARIHVIGGTAPSRWLPNGSIQHGVVGHDELNDIYNRSRAGLVLSFTNVSLLPMELLAAGCRPVMNDSWMARQVLSDLPVRYAPSDPVSLARVLIHAWDENVDGANAPTLAGRSWNAAADEFLDGLASRLPLAR